jgi:hypothetical protein
MSNSGKPPANEKGDKKSKSGGLVSIDSIIDDIGRKALGEARKKEEIERIQREQAKRSK